MLIYKGGKEVTEGTYWNVRNGERVQSGQGDRLPGGRESAYLRMHPALLFVSAPFIGLLFFLLFPVVSVLVPLALTGKKVWMVCVRSVNKLAYFEWNPGESYLAGNRKKKAREDSENKEQEDKEQDS